MHTKLGIDDDAGNAKGFFPIRDSPRGSRVGGRKASWVVDDGLLGRRCRVRCQELSLEAWTDDRGRGRSVFP